MKTSFRRLLAGACLAFAMSVPSVASAEAVTIRYSNWLPAGHIFLETINEWFADVEKATEGRVKFEAFPTNGVVPSNEAVDAVADGVLQADLISPVLYSGKDPGYALIGDLIAGYDRPDQMATWCMHGGGKEFLQQLHDKYTDGRVHVVGCMPYSREALVANTPINTVADLQGVKIRAPEGLSSEVFRRAGATPVALPFSEVYSALEKGVVDAADASAYVNNASQGFNDIAPNPLFPGIHSMPVYEFVVNKDVWDNLLDADRVSLETWYYAAYTALSRVADIEDLKLVREHSKEGSKVNVIDWAQKDRDAFRKFAAEAWSDFSKQNEIAGEIYDSHIQFLTNLGLLDE